MNPLSDAWDIAGGDPTQFPGDYRDALVKLANNRGVLPAPVYFVVPEGTADDERWQRLVAASEPQCGCMDRRLLVPERGRTRFVPHTVRQLVTIYPADKESRYESSHVLIVPHGGDVVTAHLGWSFHYNWPRCQELPLLEQPPQSSPISFSYGGAPYCRTMGGMEFDYDELAELVRRHGEVVCYRRLLTGRNSVVVPVCSVVETGQVHLADDVPLVIELDASVSAQLVMPNDMPPLHICTE
jgi:hypothetical protein